MTMHTGGLEIVSLDVLLKPCTPIHVWSGNELVKGIDFVELGNKLCIVDIDKIAKHIRPEDLAKLTSEDIARVVASYVRSYDVCKDIVDKRTVATSDRLATMNTVGVPGSSLKGYIRTAVLNYIIQNSRQISPSLWSKVLGAIDSAIEALQRGLTSIHSGRRRKEVKPKDIGQGIEGIVRTAKPRKQRSFYDLFQTLLVSDPLEKKMLRSVRMLYVKEISPSRGLADVASKLVECLDPGSVLRYRLQLVRLRDILSKLATSTNEHRAIAELLSMVTDIDTVFKALKQFGDELIEYELSRIKEVKDLEFYAKILEELRSSNNGRCVIVRIGFGSGNKAKTVLLALKRIDQTQVLNLVSHYMSAYYGRVWDDRTVKLVEYDGNLVGVGWALLCRAE